MAENTDEEHLDIPPNTQSENPSEEIAPTEDTEAITQNQEPKIMEVHHHPDLHHKPKKWKEYFLEFLMIFFAVTLGFFAESLREHISDKKKERDYIISLEADLKADIKNADQAINDSKKSEVLLDSLFTVLNDPKLMKDQGDLIYYAARLGPRIDIYVNNQRRSLPDSGAGASVQRLQGRRRRPRRALARGFRRKRPRHGSNLL